MEALAPAGRLKRLLDHDPDLGGELPAAQLDEALRRVVVRVETFEEGSWDPSADATVRGFVLLDGCLSRSTRMGATNSAELLGPGDVHLLGVADDAGAPTGDVEWQVLDRLRVGWLDHRLTAAISRWPALGLALVGRAQRRSARLADRNTILQVQRVDERLDLLMWHLAERFGRVTPSGTHLPLRLTHMALARLAGAQRPTVTTALGTLTRDARVVRRADGSWLLLGEPPAPAASSARLRAARTGRLSPDAQRLAVRATLPTRIAVQREAFAYAAARAARARSESRAVRRRTSVLVPLRCAPAPATPPIEPV